MMIDNQEILKSFSGKAPIFSLSNFVMFPKTAYSFNVFEPRYKEMVFDILETNNKHGVQVGYFGANKDNDGMALLFDHYNDLGWSASGKQ